MPRVDASADIYASKRQNFFFPGVVPSLDGQCVSLVKWFMAEMSDVPNPQAARGDARYVGKTLVAQGLAVEISYDQRRAGDIVCIEAGTYGHIWVQLSGGRLFEENVNWPGVDSKIVDGSRVYASRIGSDSEAWRHDMHVYRLKSYNGEGDNMPITTDNLYSLIRAMLRREPTLEEVTNNAYLNDPDFAIATFWNNGGKTSYENQNPTFEQIGTINNDAVYKKK